ncbi:MAG: divalent metal cation transporter [Mariniblastus sp.]
MNNTFRDREILQDAHDRGPVSTLGAFFRLSGPGWLQGAITLGGGSLGGALYLGVIGGHSMLWLQLLAIIIGVIMLSAIAYVTLSTGVRPYAAINEYVNPVLGVSWITATILANMIFILPQFSLCYDVLDTNFDVVNGMSMQLVADLDDPEQVTAANHQTKILISAVLAILAYVIVIMSFKPGFLSKMFDILLKLIVGAVVVCFIASIVYLAQADAIDWNSVLMGFIPDLRQWNTPAPEIAAMIDGLDGKYSVFWNDKIVTQQQFVMISTAATAVGINMTFLLPYSMLARGWDKPFRGLARWDLITGLAIPFIFVTSCIALASANAFYNKIDTQFESSDPAVFQTSDLFKGASGILKARILEADPTAFDEVNALADSTLDEQQAKSAAQKELIATLGAKLSLDEKKLAAVLVKPNTAQLSKSLEPLLGDRAKLVFGIGALGMGFSTIVILMLINGYAVAELVGAYHNNVVRAAGALAAGIMGFCWFIIWTGASKTWLIILASSFAAILLPIAYVAFFALMNSRRLLGDEKPTGFRMSVWNFLMTLGVIGALAQSVAAISTKISDPATGQMVIGGLAVFGLLVLAGFSACPRHEEEQ